MTYREAENIINKYSDTFKAKQFFQLNGVHCLFDGLMIAPANSSTDFMQLMYDKMKTDFLYLEENNFLNEELKVFIIYTSNGNNIIMPLSDHVIASINAS